MEVFSDFTVLPMRLISKMSRLSSTLGEIQDAVVLSEFLTDAMESEIKSISHIGRATSIWQVTKLATVANFTAISSKSERFSLVVQPTLNN